MAVELNKNELKEILLDSYELILKIPSPEKTKEGKYEIPSRSKLKNLPEALREFEDPEAAVMHFVKSSSYFLPRANTKTENFTNYLKRMLEDVQKIQKKEKDPEKVREKIKYLIGYSNWGMDAVCNIFNLKITDDEIRNRLKSMIGAELKVLGNSEEVDKIVNDLMKWKAAESRRQ
jgi:hypothetical protein